MKTVQKETFYIVGISVRTSNEVGKAMHDIPKLWQRYMEEKIAEKIPNKVAMTNYAVYTDYEKDHTKPYTMILGCEVENLDTIPTGMVGKAIEKATYQKFTVKGDLSMGKPIVDQWNKIWNMDINRAYGADFEVYDEDAYGALDGKASIYIHVE